MSDLIKRDDALHIVDVAEDEHPYKVPGLFVTYSEYNQGWSDAVDFIRSRMEKVDSVPAAPRWARCEDRYPDKDGLYMFYGDEYFTPDHNGDVDHYKTIIVGYWSHFSPTIVGNMVITHWMPLPEPPKEDV